MNLCPFCKNEVSGHQVADDDWIDYCQECGIIVEGETIDSEELHQAEEQKLQWWQQMDNDDNWIRRQLDGHDAI